MISLTVGLGFLPDSSPIPPDEPDQAAVSRLLGRTARGGLGDGNHGRTAARRRPARQPVFRHLVRRTLTRDRIQRFAEVFDRQGFVD